MLTTGRFSYGSACESAWYLGKFFGVERVAGGYAGFLSLSFLFSLEDALFLLCPWFSHEVFYTVTSFNEASGDTGFSMFFNVFLFSSAAVCCYTGGFLFSFSPAFLCIFRTRGSVRIMGVRR